MKQIANKKWKKFRFVKLFQKIKKNYQNLKTHINIFKFHVHTVAA